MSTVTEILKTRMNGKFDVLECVCENLLGLLERMAQNKHLIFKL